MILTLDFNDAQQFTDDSGDLILLDEFVKDVESGAITNDDGFACEVVHGNRVLFFDTFDATDVTEPENLAVLRAAQDDRGPIYIAWYNK